MKELKTLSITMLRITTPRITTPSKITLSIPLKNVTLNITLRIYSHYDYAGFYCYAVCLNVECRYAECHCAECRGANDTT